MFRDIQRGVDEDGVAVAEVLFSNIKGTRKSLLHHDALRIHPMDHKRRDSSHHVVAHEEVFHEGPVHEEGDHEEVAHVMVTHAVVFHVEMTHVKVVHEQLNRARFDEEGLVEGQSNQQV